MQSVNVVVVRKLRANCYLINSSTCVVHSQITKLHPYTTRYKNRCTFTNNSCGLYAQILFVQQTNIQCCGSSIISKMLYIFCPNTYMICKTIWDTSLKCYFVLFVMKNYIQIQNHSLNKFTRKVWRLILSSV